MTDNNLIPVKKSTGFKIMLGADPELFIVKNGKVVESEKIIPKDGVSCSGSGKIIRDGIQVELNPSAGTCRQSSGEYVSSQIAHLAKQIVNSKDYSDAEISPSVTVKLSKTHLNSMSEYSKTLGCHPSKNFYDKEAEVGVQGRDYLSRSAGGHIHIGNSGTLSVAILQTVDDMLPVLDIIVGNTCVLLDRDEGNIERRKTYGRAGEYRLPKHGLEYRTLSNFWLRNYTVMSLVFGLVRQAVNLVYWSQYNRKCGGKDFVAELKELVNKDDIVNAINLNDYELALKNFNAIKDYVCSITNNTQFDGYSDSDNPISSVHIKALEKLIEKGIDHYFPSKNIAMNWLTRYLDMEGSDKFFKRIIKE